MNGQDLRKKFVEFFQSYDHTWVPSAPVIPKDDPTLLFTNAGMNQFKSIFLNKEIRDYQRAVNYQKCIRVSGKHNDLEEVGRDGRHHTFFEMLGNWSFGDYYKKEAIQYAWEFLTITLKIPAVSLWATVFNDDDESEECWRNYTNIDPSHILRFGMKDNFWEMGDVGPCGPCSEIHYDRGESFATLPKGSKEWDGGRFWEIWNLVFIQYNRLSNGSLEELPSKHVDTGMGLERLASILQGKESNYETDLFWPLIEKLVSITGVNYEPALEGMSFRVIADHVRALSIALADGALPSNDGQGYVLRRLLRRAARYGHQLNMKQPFIYQLVPTVVTILGEAYPELKAQSQHISLVIQNEEERFFRTLEQGLHLINRILDQNRELGISKIPGDAAFTLYDTYGFPLDLTQLIAAENQMEVDITGFQQQMAHARDQSRKTGRFVMDLANDWIELTPQEHSRYVGYDQGEIFTQIAKYSIPREGEIAIILRETPFYAESGGQIGDTGWINGPGFEIEVYDTQQTMDGIIHKGRLKGQIETAEVKASVHYTRLSCIARHHTATHLLQAALRELFGVHIHQSGSLVNDERLRFDFTHFHALNPDELNGIEEKVNQWIMADYPVNVAWLPIEEAKAQGAMALFGEKYNAVARVITIGPVSKELCGGVHCHRTGELGLFRIIHEGAVAAGVRRIEAKTGSSALQHIQLESGVLRQISQTLSVNLEHLPEKIVHIIEELKQKSQSLEKLENQMTRYRMADLIQNPLQMEGINLIVGEDDFPTQEAFRQAADFVRDKVSQSVVVLFGRVSDKMMMIVTIDSGLQKSKKQLHAGKIVSALAGLCGGKGGGNPSFAQAGIHDHSQIERVLKQVPEVVLSFLG